MTGEMLATLFTLIVSAAVAAVVTACGHTPRTPLVTIGDAEFVVEVLRTPEERSRGLSGRPSLEPGSGALFVFESGRASAFWMKGMLFDLDFVWIGGGCTVVDVTERVPRPAPGTPDGSLPIYSAAAPAAYNLEINAGEAESAGVVPGDRIRFSGVSVDGNGC